MAGHDPGTMKTFSRLPPLPRPHGGALRVLTICVAVISLGVIGWLITLPADLQGRHAPVALGLIVLAALVLGVAWLTSRGGGSIPLHSQHYWLARAEGMDTEGPFTVAQIVALWKQGQITTTGMACRVGTETWLPLARFAPQWDASLDPPKRSSLARNGAAVFLLGLLLLLIVPPVGVVLTLLGLVLWIVGRSI